MTLSIIKYVTLKFKKWFLNIYNTRTKKYNVSDSTFIQLFNRFF